MIVVFFLLGVLLGFGYYLVDFLSKMIKTKWIIITLDIVFMLVYSIIYFCFLLGYCNAQPRYYHFLLTVFGAVIYHFANKYAFSKIANKSLKYLKKSQ